MQSMRRMPFGIHRSDTRHLIIRRTRIGMANRPVTTVFQSERTIHHNPVF